MSLKELKTGVKAQNWRTICSFQQVRFAAAFKNGRLHIKRESFF